MNNPPAFPQPITKDVHGNILTTDDVNIKMSGMTLRDYFAGQIMAGRAANPKLLFSRKKQNPRPLRDVAAESAERCYVYADAMLAAREKGPQ